MTILVFGFYKPGYGRNRVLMKGLRQNGVKILECYDNHWGLIRFLVLFLKYLKFIGNFDLMLVAFPGQEAMFLARFLTRKPIILDVFTSHYGGYILDRGKFPKNSLKAEYFRFLDKWSCRLADLVLLDTQAHINFFVSEFNLPAGKFERIFVGTDTDVFYPRPAADKNHEFLVHFHGNYIPLQGVECIIEAAKLIEKENIIFNLIGRGQTFESNKNLAKKLNAGNINFLEPIAYEKLPDFIAKADLCLGIFGATPKTRLVIPNKIYEYAAMAKPIITLDTPAVRELFSNQDLFLIKKPSPELLAQAIIDLKNNFDLMITLAQNCYKKFKDSATPEILGKQLEKIIHEQFKI